jgi:hypothetical protein
VYCFLFLIPSAGKKSDERNSLATHLAHHILFHELLARRSS